MSNEIDTATCPNMHGICMGYACGVCMEDVWNKHGTCMEYVWNILGACMKHVWNMHLVWMGYAWDMHGICVEHAWEHALPEDILPTSR